jgi:hypothetical protein
MPLMPAAPERMTTESVFSKYTVEPGSIFFCSFVTVIRMFRLSCPWAKIQVPEKIKTRSEMIERIGYTISTETIKDS